MATTAPPSITALPAAPDPADRSTFNTRAYPWSAALPTFGTQVSAVATNVKANADDCATKAGLTAADAVATAADRVQTGLDRAAAAASAATASSAVAFVDSNAVVKGSADATKLLRFEVDGFTTGTTRVITPPDADITLFGAATAVTLTNKTFTGYTETVYALSGTTPAFSESNGSIQTWTLSAASTPTDSLTTGQSLILVITPGAYSITWPGGLLWTKVGGSGAAPTLYSAGKTTVILWKIGSQLYASHLGDM